jgi:transposase InsO family protein
MATMDVIDGLPPSNMHRLMQRLGLPRFRKKNFIPRKHPYIAVSVADAFLANVYKLHGLPASIVSDRDLLFTSHFWQAVFRAIGTQLQMNTPHHPQTDGQTERVNQSLECFLCCFITANPHHWTKWLSLCEFWYNTNWHSSLGKTPFEVLYGRQHCYLVFLPLTTLLQ